MLYRAEGIKCRTHKNTVTTLETWTKYDQNIKTYEFDVNSINYTV